jgi:hypothetical protein
MMLKNTNEKRKTKIDKNMLGAKLGGISATFFLFNPFRKSVYGKTLSFRKRTCAKQEIKREVI